MSRDVLIVVDAQNDFVTGSLGSEDAVTAMEHAVRKAHDHQGPVLFTLDTHQSDYLQTQEGSLLPVEHCIEGTDGWKLIPEMAKIQQDRDATVFKKPTFTSVELGEYIAHENEREPIDSIELIGLCTDICVVSNALAIKGFVPEVPIKVDASCCAGTSRENHEAALQTMRCCQIDVA